MDCYKSGGCGVYENRSCKECPASKPEYLVDRFDNIGLVSKELMKRGYTKERAEEMAKEVQMWTYKNRIRRY